MMKKWAAAVVLLRDDQPLPRIVTSPWVYKIERCTFLINGCGATAIVEEGACVMTMVCERWGRQDRMGATAVIAWIGKGRGERGKDYWRRGNWWVGGWGGWGELLEAFKRERETVWGKISVCVWERDMGVVQLFKVVMAFIYRGHPVSGSMTRSRRKYFFTATCFDFLF